MLSKIRTFLKNKTKHKNKMFIDEGIEDFEAYTDLNAKTIIAKDDQFKTLIFSKKSSLSNR